MAVRLAEPQSERGGGSPPSPSHSEVANPTERHAEWQVTRLSLKGVDGSGKAQRNFPNIVPKNEYGPRHSSGFLVTLPRMIHQNGNLKLSAPLLRSRILSLWIELSMEGEQRYIPTTCIAEKESRTLVLKVLLMRAREWMATVPLYA